MRSEELAQELAAQEQIYADLVGIHIPQIEVNIATLTAEVEDMEGMANDASRRDMYADRVDYYRWRASHRRAQTFKCMDIRNAEIELKKLNREENRLRLLCAELRTQIREAQHSERKARAAVEAVQVEGDVLLRDVYCMAGRMARQLAKTGTARTSEDGRLFDVAYAYLVSRGLLEK